MEKAKNRNIKFGYALIAINNAFFWYAPWLLFVYQYIDIRQATLLQLIGLVTRVLAEIPTGAVADLMGKRKTLIIAFVLTAVGETVMAFSTNFHQFALVYVLIGLGYSFYSGTIDAFMYDTLVEHKAENEYPKVLSKINAVTNISTAVATIVGGYLYRYWGGLPFLLTGFTKFVGVFIAFLVTEPKVDTFIFSLKNLIGQTTKGIEHLFNKKMIMYTLLLVLMGSFSTIAYEILDDVAVVDWGYTAMGISILYTAVILLSVPSGFLYEKVSKKFRPSLLVSGGILILVANYLFSPAINVVVWTALFLIRVVYAPLKKAAITDIINRNVSSNIRATTLSTYELIIKLPFVILGTFIGATMKDIGVRNFSVMFSATLLILFGVFVIFRAIAKGKFSKSRLQ
jgi:MFS family permease